MKHYSYFILHLITLAGPILASFDANVCFFNCWKRTLAPIVILSSVFILWDMIFTALGVWGFSPEYVIGIYIYNLPIEEVFFFISVPFCVLFLYEVATFYKLSFTVPHFLIVALNILLTGISLLYYTKLYTITVLAITILLLNLPFTKNNLSLITATYLLHLPGFFVINGILTSFPIVWYNPSYLSGFRLGSIPLEDLLYSFILVWGILYLYNRSPAYSKGVVI